MEKISRHIFQAMVGILFGYFGVLAFRDPGLEAAKWLSRSSASFIELFISINTFILILGAVQIAVAVLLIGGKFLQVALPLAAALLVGIIINLGWNEIALRDLVLLAGVAYLYFSDVDRSPGRRRGIFSNAKE